MDIEYLGWCREGTHDKVWGIMRIADYDCVTFWGKRGCKLQTKQIKVSRYDSSVMFRKKVDRGYRQVYQWELEKIYPEFQDDLEKTAVLALLKM